MTRPPVWWPAFFVAYERTDRNITASAQMVAKTRQIVHYHRRMHPEFRSKLEEIDALLAARWIRKVQARVNSQGI